MTALGEGILVTMLVTPTSDIQELRKCQHTIQTFLENTVAVDQLQNSLHRYQEAEERVLPLWTSTDPLYTEEYVEDNDSSNKNAGYLEFKKRFFRDFGGIQYRFLWPVMMPAALEIFSGKEMG